VPSPEVARAISVLESGCRCARRRAPILTQLAQLRFRLLRPIRHVHFAVHLRRDGEVLLSLPAIARAAIKLAETETAVGDERAHAEIIGATMRFAIVVVSAIRQKRWVEPRDFSQDAMHPRDLSLLTVLFARLEGRQCGVPSIAGANRLRCPARVFPVSYLVGCSLRIHVDCSALP